MISDEVEAAKALQKVKKLHLEANAIEKKRAAKIAERNALIAEIEPQNKKAWYSITDVAKHLGISFPAVKKAIEQAGKS